MLRRGCDLTASRCSTVSTHVLATGQAIEKYSPSVIPLDTTDRQAILQAQNYPLAEIGVQDLDSLTFVTVSPCSVPRQDCSKKRVALDVVSLVRHLVVSRWILASIGLGLSPNTFFQRLFQSRLNAVIRHNNLSIPTFVSIPFQ